MRPTGNRAQEHDPAGLGEVDEEAQEVRLFAPQKPQIPFPHACGDRLVDPGVGDPAGKFGVQSIAGHGR